jgi:trehalose/maltose transport system substrate-binding protein
MRHWSSAYSGLRNDKRISSAVTLLPSGKSGRRAQAVGGFHLSVSRYSTHPREAAQLVSYLTAKAVQMRRALRRGFLPTYPELLRSPELHRVLPQSQTLQSSAAEDWIARPSTVSGSEYPAISRAYYRTVHSILSGGAPADSALPLLQKELAERVSPDAGQRRK